MAEAGTCSPGRTAVPACAALTRELGGEPAGTAAHMTSWLLIEQPGSWAPDALEDVLAEVLPAGRLDA
ncbi:sucrase ferredoxin, partial [Amycolatopsis sp. NPDC051114]